MDALFGAQGDHHLAKAWAIQSTEVRRGSESSISGILQFTMAKMSSSQFPRKSKNKCRRRQEPTASKIVPCNPIELVQTRASHEKVDGHKIVVHRFDLCTKAGPDQASGSNRCRRERNNHVQPTLCTHMREGRCRLTALLGR